MLCIISTPILLSDFNSRQYVIILRLTRGYRYCVQVNSGWVADHAYECSKSGACHDYGKSSRCAASNPNYYCDGRDSWKRAQAWFEDGAEVEEAE